MLAGAYYVAQTGNNDIGVVCGGYVSAVQNVIQKFTYQTAANATDHGDLTDSKFQFAASSGNAS